MKKENGFSLVELIIVVTIIGIISAFAVPGLRKARRNAQMGSAIQSMRTITTAQVLYERKYKNYGTLTDLVPEGSLDPNLGVGVKADYVFTLTVGGTPVGKAFTCTATPLGDSGTRDHFFVDETTVIKFKTGAPADANSDPIPR
jgi:prepilin-type N-terminal cleavage/methylation domain-containing protein